MCGRYVVARTLAGDLASLLDDLPGWPADFENFNIAPTAQVPVVVADSRLAASASTTETAPTTEPALPTREVSLRHAEMMQWGFVASWKKSFDERPQPFNARLEGAPTNGMFRSAFATRHCLVPASGYFEWKKEPDGAKQAFYIWAPGGLVFAGIFDAWGENHRRSMAILTRDAQGPAAGLHDRLPVMLPEDAWEIWLEGNFASPAEAVGFLMDESARVARTLRFHPVDPKVGNVRNSGPSLIDPLTDTTERGTG